MFDVSLALAVDERSTNDLTVFKLTVCGASEASGAQIGINGDAMPISIKCLRWPIHDDPSLQ
jgi:hypothetical protein